MNFIPKAYICESYTPKINTNPVFIDDISAIQEDVLNNLNSTLTIPKDVIQSLSLQTELNQTLWDEYTLKPQIKQALLKITREFFKELKLPDYIKLKDVLFVGSLANYNWSKFSDIDLHLVLDFSEFNDDPEFIKKHFDNEKNLWNNTHNVEIKSFEIEIYVQDIKEKLSSSAVYSIVKNKWVIKPEREKFKLDKELIKRRLKEIFKHIAKAKDLYQNKDYENALKKITEIKDFIKKMRKSGLENGGEFSNENMIFKILRRTDITEILDSYKNNAYDKMLSI